MPAVNPDVTILHAQRADRRGNVAIDGIVGAAREAALAATKLLVTVEKIVDELPPAMNNVVLPHFTVTAVSHCPGGAWPSYAQGHYARDNDFYLRWDAIARDRRLDRPPASNRGQFPARMRRTAPRALGRRGRALAPRDLSRYAGPRTLRAAATPCVGRAGRRDRASESPRACAHATRQITACARRLGVA